MEERLGPEGVGLGKEELRRGGWVFLLCPRLRTSSAGTHPASPLFCIFWTGGLGPFASSPSLLPLLMFASVCLTPSACRGAVSPPEVGTGVPSPSPAGGAHGSVLPPSLLRCWLLSTVAAPGGAH